jgi:hypothetical protein
MLPKINGKSFLECNEEDLLSLIENPDFRENEYIDYKQNFAFLEITDKAQKDKKKSEFKNDVCSFANAEGGYIIYGISDKSGCAAELIGINIPNDNTDKFELDRRNDLQAISPRTPNVKFSFIKLKSGKYVVILYIKHDGFAPYTYVENQTNYKFFRRAGNEKITMTYTELRNMFNQSLSLDKEIYNYRTERINYYKGQSETVNDAYSKFMLLHIIPDTFIDADYNHNMFAIEKTKNIRFSSIFSEFECYLKSIPCVDGLRYPSYSFEKMPSECYIYNNGIIECFLSIEDIIERDKNCFPSQYLWSKIESTIENYISVFRELDFAEKVFVCISTIGCKGMISEASYVTWRTNKIDRNNVMCVPVGIEDIADDNEVDLVMKKIYIEYFLSLGIKHDETLNKYINEIYG